MKFTKPNFKNSILNVSASLAKFLGCPNTNATNKIIDKELKNNYKNVVFIIFDGMGINPLNINLNKNTIIQKNIKSKITSVFPSTTTNATTSLVTNSYPMQHGWLGWCVHFEELNDVVDLYFNQLTYSDEKIDPSFLKNKIPKVPFFKFANTDYKINQVVPPFWNDGLKENKFNFENFNQMFEHISNICSQDGKQFIYCYSPLPDSTMHDYGVSSKEAKLVFEDINARIEHLANTTKDTIFIITADHGQTDVTGYINLYEDKILNSMLMFKPYLEPRATAFKVKEGYDKQFKKYFNKTYGKDFKLMSSKKLIAKNYFGPKTKNASFLADYIAVCKTDKLFMFSEKSHKFKGHHTSLGKEMWVPLIIIK